MNDGVVHQLERAFGRERLTIARARFDGPEVPMLAPATSAEFCEALLLARSESWVVVPTGLGSKLAWTRAPKRVDFLLSTKAYAGVVAYEPGDGTLTALAGSPMAELALRVKSGGHALTPDVPRPQSSTLGGVIAAAQSGSDRLRYGPVRDHVLGVQVALSDGSLARSGGRLVKNVTGYDLQRLFTGSHGTLCVILEATLRLFPLPESDLLITTLAANRAEALQLSNSVLETDARPIAVRLARLDPSLPGGEWMLCVRLGGRREVVAAERAALTPLLPRCQVLEDSEARRESEAFRDRDFAQQDGPLLRIEVRPSAVAAAMDRVEELLRTPEAKAAFRPRWWCDSGLAIIDVALRPTAHEPQLLSRFVSTLRAALEPLAGRARLFHAPSDSPIDPYGEPAAGIDLMRAIRERVDPARVFAAGRFLETR